MKQHEMPVRTLLGRIRRDFALAYLALYGDAVAVEDPHRPAAHLRDVALFEEHETARHR